VPSDLRSDPHTRNNLVPKSNEQIANKQTKTQREREGKDFPELSTQFSVVFLMTSQPKDHNKDKKLLRKQLLFNICMYIVQLTIEM